MKNKDKYDLRELDCGINWMINGCGRHIDESRTLTITKDENGRAVVLKKKKTQQNIIRFLLEWL